MRKKSSSSFWYVLFALAALTGLLIMSNKPAFVTAAPLSDDARLKAAWERAAEAGVYNYRTDVLQTTHPTLKLVNVGRSSKTDRITVAGLMDRPNDTMHIKMQGEGSIELKVEQGISYGRLDAQEEWTLVENQSDFFAPGGDPLGYLNAAENVRDGDIGDLGLDSGALCATRQRNTCAARASCPRVWNWD